MSPDNHLLHTYVAGTTLRGTVIARQSFQVSASDCPAAVIYLSYGSPNQSVHDQRPSSTISEADIGWGKNLREKEEKKGFVTLASASVSRDVGDNRCEQD